MAGGPGGRAGPRCGRRPGGDVPGLRRDRLHRRPAAAGPAARPPAHHLDRPAAQARPMTLRHRRRTDRRTPA
ncbi:hypothetical protein [Ornithinimicrobium kibberense]|uniref:hypothetical protein n=1 Tax=Ornithinimicrobium kibberense TaxID=282060 RepID=UPI00362138FF